MTSIRLATWTSRLALDPMTGSIPPEHLPKAGFRLGDASIEEAEPDRRRSPWRPANALSRP